MGDRAKLFLSSRFTEFQSLRAVVARRLTSAGYEVIDLQDGRAVPMSAAGRSTEEVRNADGLILLNGQTYAETDDPAYVSPTHQEWKAAVEAEIPVFAYATAPVDRDPRLTAMLEALSAVSVIGDLDGGVEELDDDAERIINDVDAWAALSDEDTASGQRRGLYDQIARELDTMGAALTGPTAKASMVSHRLRGEIHERATLALQALKAGDRTEARRQVEAALGVYQYDWLTNYVQSRLLEARGWNNDLTAAYTAACRSLQTVVDEDVPDELTMRRLVILNNLRARLARRRGDFTAALESAQASLQANPRSGDGLAEAARSSSALGDGHSAVRYAHTLLELYPDRAVTLMRDPLLAHAQPGVERALIRPVMERIRQAGGAAAAEEVASPRRLRDALALYRKHVATWRRDLGEEVALVAEGVLGGPGEGSGVLQQLEDHAHHIALLSQLADQVAANGAEASLSADIVALLPATTVQELGKLAGLQAAVRDFDVPGRFKPAAWSAGTGALLLCALLAGRPLGVVTDSSLFTLLMLVLAVTVGVRAFNQESAGRWPAKDFTEKFGGGCFTLVVAGIVGYVGTWIVRLLAPHMPAWLFLVAAAVVGVRAAKVLLGWRGSHAALATRRQELLTARERALASLHGHLADRKAALATCQEAHGAWVRRVDHATHHAGLPTHTGLYGHILHLGSEIVAFNRALAAYPNWGFADYVPVARARRGDLTRVDADPSGRLGGLLNGADLRRVVRVVDDNRVSDLALFGDDLGALVRLEDALVGALVVRQAAEAAGRRQPDPGHATSDHEPSTTYVGPVSGGAPTMTSPA